MSGNFLRGATMCFSKRPLLPRSCCSSNVLANNLDKTSRGHCMTYKLILYNHEVPFRRGDTSTYAARLPQNFGTLHNTKSPHTVKKNRIGVVIFKTLLLTLLHDMSRSLPTNGHCINKTSKNKTLRSK